VGFVAEFMVFQVVSAFPIPGVGSDSWDGINSSLFCDFAEPNLLWKT
jgi:hypothetical protein